MSSIALQVPGENLRRQPSQWELVDLHCHPLPELDDGPPTVLEALDMASVASLSGIGTVVATPHLRPDHPRVRVEKIAERCARFAALLRERQIDLKVVPGAEVSLTWAVRASDRELKLASIAQHGTTLLIETPDDVSASLGAVLYEIRSRGYQIVLAHPERAVYFHSRRQELEDLFERGVLLQVTASALLGPASSPSSRFGREIVGAGLVHIISSDAHRAHGRRRIGDLAAAADCLPSLVGDERAAWMLEEVPRALVFGRSAGIPPEVSPPRPSRRPGTDRLLTPARWRRGRARG